MHHFYVDDPLLSSLELSNLKSSERNLKPYLIHRNSETPDSLEYLSGFVGVIDCQNELLCIPHISEII